MLCCSIVNVLLAVASARSSIQRSAALKTMLVRFVAKMKKTPLRINTAIIIPSNRFYTTEHFRRVLHSIPMPGPIQCIHIHYGADADGTASHPQEIRNLKL